MIGEYRTDLENFDREMASCVNRGDIENLKQKKNRFLQWIDVPPVGLKYLDEFVSAVMDAAYHQGYREAEEDNEWRCSEAYDEGYEDGRAFADEDE